MVSEYAKRMVACEATICSVGTEAVNEILGCVSAVSGWDTRAGRCLPGLTGYVANDYMIR